MQEVKNRTTFCETFRSHLTTVREARAAAGPMLTVLAARAPTSHTSSEQDVLERTGSALLHQHLGESVLIHKRSTLVHTTQQTYHLIITVRSAEIRLPSSTPRPRRTTELREDINTSGVSALLAYWCRLFPRHPPYQSRGRRGRDCW